MWIVLTDCQNDHHNASFALAWVTTVRRRVIAGKLGGMCLGSANRAGCAGSWWSRRAASTGARTATVASATPTGTAAGRDTSECHLSCCRVSVERARGNPRGSDRWRSRDQPPPRRAAPPPRREPSVSIPYRRNPIINHTITALTLRRHMTSSSSLVDVHCWTRHSWYTTIINEMFVTQITQQQQLIPMNLYDSIGSFLSRYYASEDASGF